MKKLGSTSDKIRKRVIALRLQKKSIPEIARILGKSPRQIARICKGIPDVAPKGRPKKASDAEVARAYRQLAANAITWRDAAANIGISVSQLRRRIAEMQQRKEDRALKRYVGSDT